MVTGSSDHHGTGKIDHDLGCNTTHPDELERLVAAGSPGAVPHVIVTPRRLLPDRTVPQGVDGFPVGVLRYRFTSTDPLTAGAVMTEEAESLVLTDGRVVAVAGDELVDVDHGVVRDRLDAFARRHGVTPGS